MYVSEFEQCCCSHPLSSEIEDDQDLRRVPNWMQGHSLSEETMVL